ncbi:hypothetical protein [Rhizobium sp. Leaf341]|uniref:hypothetical protein n=1 Tax=Rhizobium sp. Leaf341 TaxID=1736344 RepID=UPI00071382D8|nr:hypothetical protein [Rhizobium sp. Leaf341]KQR77574.1 hypothetical protein ASG03_14285 [Rhizobium sp. Leaf341]
MGWVPDNIIQELRGSHQLGIFMRVDTDPALHLWFGVNDMPIGFDSIDPDGTVYLGGGRLQGIPTLEILVNGTSDSVEFTISGIEPEAGSKMINSLPPVRGAEVHMGITTLDQYFQPMSKIIPLWQGTASHIGEASPAVQSGQSPSLTLSLAVAAGNETRSRPSRSLWSSAHQKAIYPTDKFCDGTARLARGVQPSWPQYG